MAKNRKDLNILLCIFHLALPSLLWCQRSFEDFSGGPVAKTPHFQCRGMGSGSGWELKSHMQLSSAKQTTKNQNQHLVRLLLNISQLSFPGNLSNVKSIYLRNACLSYWKCLQRELFQC